MLTPAFPLPELLALAGKSELTMADLEHLHGRPLPDGSQLRFPKVAPEAWASLAAGTHLAFRLVDSPAALTGQVMANRLGHRLAPVLLVSHPRSAEPLRVKRRQLREVRRIDKA